LTVLTNDVGFFLTVRKIIKKSAWFKFVLHVFTTVHF